MIFLQAFFVHKQKMYGCFHENIAGTMSTDVHVIGKLNNRKISH